MENGYHKKPNRLEVQPRNYFIIPIIFMIVYVLFLFGKSVYNHYRINNELHAIQEQITDLEDQKKELENAIAYYKTASFLEKEARSKLGYRKSGETAIALSPTPEGSRLTEEQEKLEAQDAQQEKISQPNYIRWFNYLFK